MLTNSIFFIFPPENRPVRQNNTNCARNISSRRFFSMDRFIQHGSGPPLRPGTIPAGDGIGAPAGGLARAAVDRFVEMLKG
jgi:hypothetical protein